MAAPTRRRSERLLLSIPIRVEGSNVMGRQFAENARTLIINRHGARIQLKQPLAPGSTIKILNTSGNREAQFRVVGPTQPLTEQEGEWGVECKDEGRNIWGIEFPPSHDEESLCSAVLECRRCNTVVLTPLSLVEHDVLATSGLLTKECKHCGRQTPWGYPEEKLAAAGLGVEGDLFTVPGSPESPAASGRRASGRVPIRLPVRVRNFYGVVDFAKTENVAKAGVCFSSDKDYEIGEMIQVTCPYEPAAATHPELRARVVRRYGVKTAGRRVYAVSYEKEPG